MGYENLKDVYIDQLQDLYSATRQARPITQKMAEVASHRELRAALARGVGGIDEGIKQLETLLKTHDADLDSEVCKGMEGLVTEALEHGIDAEFKDSDVQDAVLITQYQRMAHYAIAGYGCLAAFARRLGLKGEAKTLQTCLDNTYHGDKEMSRIATGEVNPDAT